MWASWLHIRYPWVTWKIRSYNCQPDLECRVCSTFDIKPFCLKHIIYCLAYLLDIFIACLPYPACHNTLAVTAQNISSKACLPDIFTALLAFLFTYLLPCLSDEHIYCLPALPSTSQCMAGHKWSHKHSQHKRLAGHTTQGPGLPFLASLSACQIYLLPFLPSTYLMPCLPCLPARHIYCLPAFPNMSQCTAGHKQSHQWSQSNTSADHNHPALNTYLIILIYIIFFTI